MFAISMMLGSYVNSRLFMGHIITKLFIAQGSHFKHPHKHVDKDHKDHHHHIKKIRFSLKDKFSHLKKTIC